MHLRKTITLIGLAIAVLAGFLTLGSGAFAASPPLRNGRCDAGEFCYHYNSKQAGAIFDTAKSIGNYGEKQPACYEFRSAGEGSDEGKGLCIKNNAASVWNRSSNTVRVYFNTNYRGAHQDFAPGAKGDLNAKLKNQNASHRSLDAAPIGCKTDGTNSKLPSTILVYRVEIGRVDRVNFKDYVKNVLPNEWTPSWESASLDAGAMAVKSFGWSWALRSTEKTPEGKCYDVRDDDQSQLYRPSSAVPATDAAVDRTWDMRMTRSGKIFQAQYCKTTSVCDAWVDGDWMSQEGSQQQAKAGKKYQEILRSYYRGITLTP